MSNPPTPPVTVFSEHPLAVVTLASLTQAGSTPTYFNCPKEKTGLK